MTKWIDVKERLPKPSEKEETILILVNKEPFLCDVIPQGLCYLITDRFCYTKADGFHGDKRFAKPTHWMPIEEATP
jgi:Protein of unknown function (DUF551)